MTDCHQDEKLVNSLFSDTKSLLSSYIYWKKSSVGCVEFFYEKTPFGGDYVVVSGIDEINTYLKNFSISDSDIIFIKSSLESQNIKLENEFYDFLRKIDLDDLTLIGYDTGSIIKEIEKPVIILHGNLSKIKLLTYAISNLLSFSSLISTNSARMRTIADYYKPMILLEFGLRRAQGPLAALIASKYSYLAFDAVSNVLSGYYYNIPVRGTCAHAYIMSYQGEYYKKINEYQFDQLSIELFNQALEIRSFLKWEHTNLNELFSFATFTAVYQESSNLLVDTFNTIDSGIKNAIIISLALIKLKGKVIRGVRLDSGDLPNLSKRARELILKTSQICNEDALKQIKISASNDINENSINNFNKNGHEMDIYGIGTNLVTCQLQPFMTIITHTKTHYKDEVQGDLKTLFKNGESLNEKDFSKLKQIFLSNYSNQLNK